MASPQPLLPSNAGDRIRGIASYVVRDEYIRDDVCQRVVAKLQQLEASLRRLDTAFLAVLVRHARNDHYREVLGFVPIDEVDELDDDHVYARRNTTKDLPPPLEVLQERIRLIYGSGESRPHELIAFAYNAHLGNTPAGMAGELGDVALATLAQNFALEFADRAEVPLPHIEDLFCDLLSIRAQPVGQTALRDYWKPADIIEDWVSGEPPLDAPAHKRIAFLFHRELGFSVVDILTRLGDLTIQETTVKFIDLYAHKANCDRAAGLHLFRSRLITPETAARRTLGSYYSPARTVGRWTWSVYNRGTNAEARQEKTGLRLIFECGEPHETLAFVLTFLCRGEAEDVASRNWSQTLGAIAERTVFAYAAQRGAPVRTAETWFSPLRRTIRRCGLEETVWSKFCSSEADRAWTICDWRKKVLDRVRAGLPKRAGVVLFAYRYGLPWK